MARTAAAKIRITGDADGVKKAARDAEGAFSRLSKAAKFAVAGVAVAGVGVVKFGQEAVSAAGDLNEELGKTEQVFKGSAKGIQNWSKTAATSIGMSRRQALEATGTFGNMLVPMGLARDKAAGMSKSMVSLAGDLASFNNASPEETLDALRAGLAGETEPLRRFGVFLTAARVEQEAMRMGLAKTKDELTAGAKAQATYSLIMKDSKDAQGDFARTSGGLANQQRIVRAQIEDTSAKIGSLLLPVMAKTLTKFNEFLTWIQVNWPAMWQMVQAQYQRVADWFRGNRTMQEIVANVRTVVDYVRENWPQMWADFKRQAEPVLRWIGTYIGHVMGVVQGAIEIVVNFIQGDWSEAWNGLKRVVTNAIGALGTLVAGAAKAGVKIGKAVMSALWGWISDQAAKAGTVGLTFGKKLGAGIANGLIGLVEWAINKVIAGANSVGGVINKLLPGNPVQFDEVHLGRVGSGGNNTGDVGAGTASAYMASGGVVPGPAGAGDIVPARLTPGEVVLNKRQQALVGASRIMSVLAATGGKIGQGRFATGGVATALKFAQAQLGEPYVWGGGHEGVVERRGWDCSGFASNVAARVPGYTGGIGTTMSLYPRSKRATGNEPVVFGFLGMDSNDPRKQHMGIRINGQWFEAAGGGRGVIRGRSNWPSGLRIPPGLEYLSTQKASSSPNEADGGQSPVTRQAAAQKAAVTKAVAAALKGISYSEREGMSSSPSGGAASTISAAVTAAGRAAMAAGQSPEQIREVMDDEQRNREIAWVKREIAKALAEMRKVSGAITKVRARLKTARKALGKARAVKGRARGPAVQKAYGVVLALVKKEQELLEAQSGVREWLTDLRARALDLDIAAQEDALEGTDTSSSTSLSDTSVDADTSAQLSQAQAAAATAQAGQLAGDQFIRAALGPGDLTQGGLTAWQAAGGTLNVNVQTLHPGDPNTLQAIVEAVARAANQSPSTMATGQVVTV